ncbi:MAG TPA: hypothetical protein PKE06_05220 [Flavilitoribacter sp.]|nr:hypothetical protein [Lewinella sp.]MCB9278170.1 hypothetical protein [Lewinellaceae bacterium]HMQ60047.1 hypothetical protein [Flavilitoribacter sp.]HMQ86571.1 hypothetical protein [Flavilitoribacter sp.]
MKKIITTGLITGVVLLVLGFGMVYLTVLAFPGLAEQYYNPVFRTGDDRSWLFFVHPFILGLGLAWFWERFKGQFNGWFLLRGLELGLVYVAVAVLPSMWITFSAIDVSLTMILTWLLYGFVQAAVAGILLARLNP